MNRYQRGFSIALVLFVLIVISSLGLALMQTSALQRSSSSMEVLSNRAFYAAESGAQLFASQLFPLNAPNVTSCSTPVYTFNGVSGLAQCSASITECSVTNAALDGANNSTFIQYVSEGRCGAKYDQTVRRLRIMVRSL